MSGRFFWLFISIELHIFVFKMMSLDKTYSSKRFEFNNSQMKARTLKIKEKDKWAIPGEPITVDEFKAGIKEAEKGPFFTIDESKKILQEWRKPKNSQ